MPQQEQIKEARSFKFQAAIQWYRSHAATKSGQTVPLKYNISYSLFRSEKNYSYVHRELMLWVMIT
jgi:hypothetical protein